MLTNLIKNYNNHIQDVTDMPKIFEQRALFKKQNFALKI